MDSALRYAAWQPWQRQRAACRDFRDWRRIARQSPNGLAASAARAAAVSGESVGESPSARAACGGRSAAHLYPLCTLSIVHRTCTYSTYVQYLSDRKGHPCCQRAKCQPPTVPPTKCGVMGGSSLCATTTVQRTHALKARCSGAANPPAASARWPPRGGYTRRAARRGSPSRARPA